MAAPIPPQGNQHPVTAKPVKVYGEQYVDGQPLPIGAVINPLGPEGTPLFDDGLPHVLTPAGWVTLQISDWILSNRQNGAVVEVLPADEFSERFNPG